MTSSVLDSNTFLQTEQLKVNKRILEQSYCKQTCEH